MLLRRNNQDMLPMVLTLALSSGKLVGSQGVHQEEHYEPSPYHYEYKVHDDKEYLGFGAEEEGDGKDNVVGFYHVQLPDGRLQKVTYTVNGYGGYIADVAYDGEAAHPSYHGGGGHGGGHRFGKSLAQEPFQRRPDISVESGRSGKALAREPFQQKPKISVQSERVGKSHFEKQEENNFSGVFFGASSRHSNSAPSEIKEHFQRKPSISDRSGKSKLELKLEEHNFSQGLFGSLSGQPNIVPSEIEEQKKSIPEPNQNTFPRSEDQPSSKKPFTLEHKPLKRVFKKFDQSKVSQPKSKPFTTFAKADPQNFKSKPANFGGQKRTFTNQDSNKGNQEKSKPSTFSSGSPKTLDEFLKTFESKSSSFGKGKKPFTNQGFNKGKNKPSSGSPKTLDEFLKTFEPKSSKLSQLKSSQKKAPKVSSESTFGSFRSSPPPFDSSSSSSRRSEQSRSSKNLKGSSNQSKKSSLIVHRPLAPQ